MARSKLGQKLLKVADDVTAEYQVRQGKSVQGFDLQDAGWETGSIPDRRPSRGRYCPLRFKGQGYDHFLQARGTSGHHGGPEMAREAGLWVR